MISEITSASLEPALSPAEPIDTSGERVSEQQRRFIDALWLVCLMVIVSAKSICPAAAMDEDLWWHLSAGDWIVKHAAVPWRDVFSRYGTERLWIDYSWLFDVSVSRIFSAWGLHGILVFTTLLTLAFVAALVFLFSHYCRMLRAIALAALVFCASSALITPRPWLASCIFFVLELYLLLQARERGRVAWLLPVPLLFVLWANVHIQFIYGLGMIGLCALEAPLASLLKWPLSAKLGSRCYWALLAASITGTLLNPYGWKLYSVVVQYATENVALQVIQEMQAMQFRNMRDWAALFLVCAALFRASHLRQGYGLILSLLTVSLWFGFRSARDAWFLATASALTIAASEGPVERGLGKIRRMQWCIALPIGIGLAFVMLNSAGVSTKALQRAVGQRFPAKAAAYIESHELRNPLFNSYNWGGYLIWRLPKMPVSIDGRANVYGDIGLARFAEAWSGKPNWEKNSELMNANSILLERDSALASILRSDRRFRLVYDDERACVFVRKGN